jgi:glycosyltransferase involved in cell wall biosynthesis
MGLAVLSVAYPFAPVSRDAAGGAEQVLAQIDASLVRAGHRSIVVACEGSRVAGTLVPVPRRDGVVTVRERSAACAAHIRAIAGALERWPVDVVHLHGIDFPTYLPQPGVAVLVTLHLPIAWYPPDALRPNRTDTWLNCVSWSQHHDCGVNPRLCAPIENGVPAELLRSHHAKRSFALVVSRICPEKGVHLAIEAAKKAGVALLIAGEVFPYPEHQRYFAEQIAPRLDHARRFIGRVDFARKRRLLAAARCVLVASSVPETSSLVAREALASGTPVVAFARGALAETVEHGRTGFLVQSVGDMARAIGQVAALDPRECRDTARTRFSAAVMGERYLALYASIRRDAAMATTAGAA